MYLCSTLSLSLFLSLSLAHKSDVHAHVHTHTHTHMQVHCKNGSSQPIPIGDNVANFEQGECDIFPNIHVPVTVGDSVESITIAHDNTNPYPDWHLDKVLLINQVTGAEYLATCGK